MKVIIDSMIRIKDAAADIVKKIKTSLTIKNPEFQKKQAMKLPLWGCPREIKLYEEMGGEIIVPRGYLRELWQIQRFVPEHDRRLTLPEVYYHANEIKLRDYQAPALEAVQKSKQGVIIMPCGAGKTETGLAVLASLKQPALWLTHTKDLLNQSLGRAKTRLNLRPGEYGIIAADEMSIGSHITFGMIQTLANRDLSQIINKFGAVIIDECHHVYKNSKSVAQFYSVISQFPAKYRIGLTATAHRADGLIDTMFNTIGPAIYKVDQDALNAAGNVMAPTVYALNTNFVFDDDEPDPNKRFRLMLNQMQDDSERNEIILEHLKENQGNFNLVLGDGLQHLESLKESLGYRAAFVCGQTPKKEREKIMEDMRAGRYNYLFATYSLAKEGLDIPQLNRLYLITPKRDKATIQQAVGRIMRKALGKTDAIVYDFVDSNITTCINQFSERKRVYKAVGAQINLPSKVRGK